MDQILEEPHHEIYTDQLTQSELLLARGLQKPHLSSSTLLPCLLPFCHTKEPKESLNHKWTMKMSKGIVYKQIQNERGILCNWNSPSFKYVTLKMTSDTESVMLCARTHCSFADPIGYIEEIAQTTHGWYEHNQAFALRHHHPCSIHWAEIVTSVKTVTIISEMAPKGQRKLSAINILDYPTFHHRFLFLFFQLNNFI